jgi:hypothetical protein
LSKALFVSCVETFTIMAANGEVFYEVVAIEKHKSQLTTKPK